MQHLFTTEQGIILIRLILFHFLTDFVFQPDSWVKHRNKNHHRSSKLYWHGILAALGGYVAFWDLQAWPFFLVIAVTHVALDLYKSHQTTCNLGYFVLDQIAHIAILVICWLFWISGFETMWNQIAALAGNYKIMLLALGYVICIFPAGYFVSFSTDRWRRQIDCDEKVEDSLSEVGKWIGIIERILVFTMVYAGTFENIGLVLAAKSILRFSDAEARKNTEYVLIGTMISFTVAVVIGLCIKFLIS